MDKVLEIIHSSKAEKLKLKDIIIVCPKSKSGVKQLSEMENGEIMAFTSGSKSFYVSDYLVDGENIFMNDGGMADTKYFNGKANYSDHVYCFTTKKVMVKYLYYYLLLIKEHINNDLFTGTGLKNLNKKKFLEEEIPVPNKEIQELVVKTLDELNICFCNLKLQINEQIKLRNHQKNYYFNKAFNFDNFSIKKLKEVSKITDSLHATPKYVDEGFPMIRVADVKGGYIDTSKALKVDNDTYINFIKRYEPQFNDIIISRVGSFGNFALVPDEKVCLGQNVSLIHPLINPMFLYYSLHSEYVDEYVVSVARGSGYKNIGLKEILEIPIRVPSLEKQNATVMLLSQIENTFKHEIGLLEEELILREKQLRFYFGSLFSFGS